VTVPAVTLTSATCPWANFNEQPPFLPTRPFPLFNLSGTLLKSQTLITLISQFSFTQTPKKYPTKSQSVDLFPEISNIFQTPPKKTSPSIPPSPLSIPFQRATRAALHLGRLPLRRHRARRGAGAAGGSGAGGGHVVEALDAARVVENHGKSMEVS
jgi:hypothetical protein